MTLERQLEVSAHSSLLRHVKLSLQTASVLFILAPQVFSSTRFTVLPAPLQVISLVLIFPLNFKFEYLVICFMSLPGIE